MSNISASQVKELREKTGLGLMDCKKALETQGDMELAMKSSERPAESKQVKNQRISCRWIDSYQKPRRSIFHDRVNCETDFVARDDSFVEFTSQTLDSYVSNPDVLWKKFWLTELRITEKRLFKS